MTPNYRCKPLDLPTRMTLAIEMLAEIPQRPWGYVTKLAQTVGVSRTWLYELRNRAKDALMETFCPSPPGPKEKEDGLVINDAFVQRAITILPLLKGSVRGIQTGLDLLFDVHRSIGYIEKTLQEADTVISKSELKRRLPTQIMHQTLNLILEYLEKSGKIIIGSKGITWIYNDNSKLKSLLKKAVRVA